MCTKLHGCTEEVCASNCHCTAHFACRLTWSHSEIAHFIMPCNIYFGQNIVMNRMESSLYVLLVIYYVYISLMLVFIVHFSTCTGTLHSTMVSGSSLQPTTEYLPQVG